MTSREHIITDTLVRLADTLVTDYDVLEMFYFLAESSRSVLDVSQTGLLLIDATGDLQVAAATSEATHLIELLQIQNEEGPCLDALRSGTAVMSGPLDEEAALTRWPVLARAAHRAGFSAIVALPMRLRETVIGALNMFLVTDTAMPDRDIAVAQAFADIGTIAILQDRATRDARDIIDQLQRALDSRVVIEQSKGIVAQHAGVSMDQSFASIRSYARNNNKHLREVARLIVAGELQPRELIADHPTVDSEQA